MDTSETYTKMCEKAEEVQAERPECPNQFRHYDFKTLIPIEGSFIGRAIWLPSQDQLQEMVGEFNLLSFWQKFFSYSDYIVQTEVGFELPEWAKHCNSWEQLWLAFVMKEKYGKKWDGEKWSK